MLSRHWRLWLSFPSLALPPEERLGISLSFPSSLCAHASWARSLVSELWSRRLTEPPRPSYVGDERGCEGGGFSERSSATSIGAAYGRLFRLRKTAMLSRHWRLWLSFPSLALPPEEQLGISLPLPSSLCAHASWARSLVSELWSRRLTEPPRPANVEERKFFYILSCA